MAIITVNPGSDRIYDHRDFRVYIKNVTSGSIDELKLDKRFTCEHFLKNGDTIGLTYLSITQDITDIDNGTGNSTVTATGDDPLTLHIIGVAAGETPLAKTIVKNDVEVNVNSFNQKEPIEIKLTPSTGLPTRDQSFWDVINGHQLDFKHYRNFINDILLNFDPTKPISSIFSAKDPNTGLKSAKPLPFDYPDYEQRVDSKRLPFNRTEGYSLLKYATERYVEHFYDLKTYIDEDVKEKFQLDDYLGPDRITPYYDLIKSKIREYFPKENAFSNQEGNNVENSFLKANADTTLIELIWNYWYAEGMVNQTMTAISRRFQNIKNGYKDPLLNFALDPLRPLNNILWGYIQDTPNRLSPTRLNYEFAGEYDLVVLSTLKPGFNPADRRSKFLLSFHRLIYEATEYFVQSDNTTIRPDGFKLLNALRDTHRILAEGANNQFGDLPTVARIETLIEQWILSRPEVREFLGGRVMVPYEEPWMDRVDSMKTLQGWDNTSISFYRDLAVYGEKIILGIRYGNWSVITRRDHATNWADAFRDAIQRYIHSYYTITGVDLSAKNINMNSEQISVVPGVLINERHFRQKPFVKGF